jgi:hypothetical protein
MDDLRVYGARSPSDGREEPRDLVYGGRVPIVKKKSAVSRSTDAMMARRHAPSRSSVSSAGVPAKRAPCTGRGMDGGSARQRPANRNQDPKRNVAGSIGATPTDIGGRSAPHVRSFVARADHDDLLLAALEALELHGELGLGLVDVELRRG